MQCYPLPGDGGQASSRDIAYSQPVRLRQGFVGHFSFRFGKKSGGPDQVRTDDLRNAIAALFQLSYEPKSELPKSRLLRGNARTFYPSSFIRKVTVQV